jgi:ribosomal protein L16/L10AE
LRSEEEQGKLTSYNPYAISLKKGEVLRLDSRQIESVDEAMVEIYKKKTPTQRLQIAFGLWRSVKILLFNSLRSLHPEWDEKRLQREVARRMSHGKVGETMAASTGERNRPSRQGKEP